MERLTQKVGDCYSLILDNPQNEFEAKQQLMKQFKFAVEKLYFFEEFMEKNQFKDIEHLVGFIDALKTDLYFAELRLKGEPNGEL